jgi:hypothetical protein
MTVSRRIESIAVTAIIAMLIGCGGGSNANGPVTPFAGINRTYVLAGGIRQLQLNGLTGSYVAKTFSGERTLAVSLTRATMTIGGVSFPYLAAGNVIQGGGFVGFAATTVIDDPAAVPGKYNTIIGANFAGELALTATGKYTWCQRTTLKTPSVCADGSTPLIGSIVVQGPQGFQLSGIPGIYGAYRQDGVAALFPIDNRGLNLRAVSQTATIPSGSFSEGLLAATGSNHIASVSFPSSNLIKIQGVPTFSGTFRYSYSNGAIAYSFAACRNGRCTGIYNKDLGVVYLAEIGNDIFLEQ